MNALHFLFAVAIVVLSFFTWSKEEDKNLRTSSYHRCSMIGTTRSGGPIYSCSSSPTHNYSYDKRSGGSSKKWLPKLFSILILAALILGLYFYEIADDTDVGEILYAITAILALVFIGYCIYYFFAYDELKIIYWITAGIPIVGFFVSSSESVET